MDLKIADLRIPTQYKKTKKHYEGSAGWVVIVYEKLKPDTKIALKVLHPQLIGSDNFDTIKNDFLKEAERLKNNIHTNIVQIFETDVAFYKLENKEIELPCIAMEYIEGVEFEDWFKIQRKQTSIIELKTFVKITQQLLNVLIFLHTRPIEPLLHLDIKSPNVMILNGYKNPEIKLMDFGVAQLMGGDRISTGGEHAILVSTFDIVPSEVKDKIKRLTRKGATKFWVPRNTLSVHGEALDLHLLQDMIKRVFLKDYPEKQIENQLPEVRYFSYWLSRLNWDKTEAHLRFISAKQASNNLKRINGWIEKPSEIYGTGNLRIPVHSVEYFSSAVRKVTDTEEFQRLRSVKQLGMVHYVYPGAVHTRFEHSLGVYQTTIRYLNVISENGSPRFRSLLRNEDLRMTAALGLLHDIGHYPFAHMLNEAKIPGFPSHEKRTHEILQKSAISKIVADSFGFDEHEFLEFTKYALRIGSSNYNNKIEKTFPTWTALKCVINGPIDADKFDYLVRDAHHAGVPYAQSLDPERFLKGLVVVDKENGGFDLAVYEKAISSAEMFAVGRYFMYTSVYYLHTVRAIDRMIIETINQCGKYRNVISQKAGKEIFEQIKYFSDEEFIKFMIAKNPDSLVCKGLKNRKPFKRLVTINDNDDESWMNEASMSVSGEPSDKAKFEKLLRQWLKKEKVTYENHELLVDLPGQKTQETIIPIVLKSGKPINIGKQFWRSITDNFNIAARKFRVFVDKLPDSDIWTPEKEYEFIDHIKSLFRV